MWEKFPVRKHCARNVQKKGETMPKIEISNMKKLEKSMTISVVHGNLRFKVKSDKFGAIA